MNERPVAKQAPRFAQSLAAPRLHPDMKRYGKAKIVAAFVSRMHFMISLPWQSNDSDRDHCLVNVHANLLFLLHKRRSFGSLRSDQSQPAAKLAPFLYCVKSRSATIKIYTTHKTGIQGYLTKMHVPDRTHNQAHPHTQPRRDFFALSAFSNRSEERDGS
jgi:hypothetical protein